MLHMSKMYCPVRWTVPNEDIEDDKRCYTRARFGRISEDAQDGANPGATGYAASIGGYAAAAALGLACERARTRRGRPAHVGAGI